MAKAEGSSRVSRRMNTKSGIRVKCQRATAGIIPRERRRFAGVKLAPVKKLIACKRCGRITNNPIPDCGLCPDIGYIDGYAS